ncbi:SMP-30/gluconolactonase/LRE family protein [Aspergillus ruber CBS 135680]|uniref:Calcium-dependent phosphotriesterase n=1 Tax=Aspergillus ruber (strain CBS 135680) TaxID=1388766 RepID=A0A017SQB2_ASPRC|nr:calcium-dependent phosphotriesterase [Aspergillus ruber CBS 135680]EYE99158.1 calcium-dependent phosphotriesterase [Aspergillus ruber CBS 135680]
MSKSTNTSFQAHDERFNATNRDYPFAKEAGIYNPITNDLFIASNRCIDPNGIQKVHITRVNLSQDQVTREQIPTKIPMANGGINYGKHHMLFCAQGSMTEPSGLYRMSMAAPYESELLKQDFFGRPFNSVKDVVVHADGSVWFADPIYGYEQEYRPTPCLPNQVYWWCPNNECIKAMADRSEWPNGICFSPDEKVVYITDTDRVHGDDGTIDNQRVSSICAFDLSISHGEPCLTNCRVFAMADQGIPDGIKCDLSGNVYSGCGDGINIWSPRGTLLGRILIGGGVANFCLGRNGEIFALCKHRLWGVQLGTRVKGVLLGI